MLITLTISPSPSHALSFSKDLLIFAPYVLFERLSAVLSRLSPSPGLERMRLFVGAVASVLVLVLIVAVFVAVMMMTRMMGIMKMMMMTTVLLLLKMTTEMLLSMLVMMACETL
jgi:flagellar biosynthesis protein FlhB